MNARFRPGVPVLLALLLGCTDAPGSPADPTIAQRAEDVQPIGSGSSAPEAVLLTSLGEPFDLGAAYRQAPTLLIFHRGGWCPFCSAHLGEIAMMEDELTGAGVQVLAVSPDRPEKLRESLQDREVGYKLLSDSDMTLTRKFGLAFRLTDEEVDRYSSSGFDLVEASGHDHHLLPVPAVYLIDTSGTIRFAHWDPDYRQRIGTAELRAAVQATLGGG
jgi:peroxiredoxin